MSLRSGRQDDEVGRRFKMNEKLVSVGDDHWIEDDAGARAFEVDGKAARIRDSWEPTVRKAMIGFRDRFHVEIEHGEDLTVTGTTLITTTRSSAAARRSVRCRRSGCAPTTPTAWRCAT